MDAKRHAADAVRSQRYPTLTAQAQQYGEGGRSASGEDLSQPYILRVRQPIWAFGRIDNNIAVANAEVSTQRADLLRVRRQLLEDTAVAYAAVRGSQQHIDIARAERDSASRSCSRRSSVEWRVSSPRAPTRVWPRHGSPMPELSSSARSANGKAPATTWSGSRRWRSTPMQPVPAELLELRRFDRPDRKGHRSKRRDRRQAAPARAG